MEVGSFDFGNAINVSRVVSNPIANRDFERCYEHWMAKFRLNALRAIIMPLEGLRRPGGDCDLRAVVKFLGTERPNFGTIAACAEGGKYSLNEIHFAALGTALTDFKP
jgi:hypothetical protein